jgi:hypothetical protein
MVWVLVAVLTVPLVRVTPQHFFRLLSAWARTACAAA